MKNIKQKIIESFEYQGYCDGVRDTHFDKWKRKPTVGKLCNIGGAVFKIVKIDNNKIYVEEE